MRCFVQFPISDLRPTAIGNERIAKPSWPEPEPYREFVRFVGQVRQRKYERRGASLWATEEFLCSANKAIRLQGDADKRLTDLGKDPRDSVSRLFSSDGYGLAQFQFVVNFYPKRTQGVDSVLRQLGELEINVPAPGDSTERRSLLTAGGNLAVLYEKATAKSKAPATAPGLIRAGIPTLFLERNTFGSRAEWAEAFSGAKLVPLDPGTPIALYHGWNRFNNLSQRVWLAYEFDRSYSRRDSVRELRHCLTRLHAHHEFIKASLSAFREGSIASTEAASDALQRMLNHYTKRIRRFAKRLERGFEETTATKAAFAAFTFASPSWDACLELLQASGIRRQVMRGVRSVVNGDINIVRTVMGDITNVNANQVGAVGVGASVSHATFNSSVSNLEGIDMRALRSDLTALLPALKQHAVESQHFRALASVAEAQEAATKGDRGAVATNLRAAGTWALKIAEKIGVDIATKAIAGSIGLS